MDPEQPTQQSPTQTADYSPQARKALGRSRHEQRQHSKPNYKEAVLTTLAYFDLFQYPLTLKEVTRHLYNLEAETHHVEMALNESRAIINRGSYYQLEGNKDHIAVRHDRELIAKQLWKRVNRFRWIFSLTPYTRLVTICNNLSLDNTSNTSDIDLLVITKPGRLFTSRLFLTMWLQICGVRRYGNKVAGRFCLSFFATEGNLNCEKIEKKPYDIYLAYWLQTLEPISGSKEIYENILRDNATWLKKFFTGQPHYNMRHFRDTPGWIRTLQQWQEKILNSKWGQKLEDKLTDWQLKRANAKKADLNIEATDVIINHDMLKFHNIDKRREIYERWVVKVKELIA